MATTVRNAAKNQDRDFLAIAYINVVVDGKQIASAKVSDNPVHKLNQQFAGVVSRIPQGKSAVIYRSDRVLITLRVPEEHVEESRDTWNPTELELLD